MRFTFEFQCFLNNHHIAVYFNISTVWGFIWGRFGVLLGSVWASWPSWSRLGAILGRLDAIFDVGILCDFRVVTGGGLQHPGRPGPKRNM